MSCGDRAFGGRSSRRNFSYIDSLSNVLVLLHLSGCSFDFSTTLRYVTLTGPLGLLLRRELGRRFGLRLCRGMAFRPLGFMTGSTSLLSVDGPALLPLTTTTIVSSVVGITVGAPLLFLYNSAISVRNVWATTGHALRVITAITPCVTEALAVC